MQRDDELGFAAAEPIVRREHFGSRTGLRGAHGLHVRAGDGVANQQLLLLAREPRNLLREILHLSTRAPAVVARRVDEYA